MLSPGSSIRALANSTASGRRSRSMTSISPRREHGPTCRHVASSASVLSSDILLFGPCGAEWPSRPRTSRARPGLGLDGRERGDNIRVRRGSEYSIRTLQNADEKHGASTDFFNRCTWYLIPRGLKRKSALHGFSLPTRDDDFLFPLYSW
jgi:hypothetical protein